MPVLSHSPESSDFEPTPEQLARKLTVTSASSMMPIYLTSPIANDLLLLEETLKM